MQLLLENTEEQEDDYFKIIKKSNILSSSKLNQNEVYPYNMNKSKKLLEENKALNMKIKQLSI
jgi:hypothetical protein